MKYFLKYLTVLVTVIFLTVMSCKSENTQAGALVTKNPCDTVVVNKDTSLAIVRDGDTIAIVFLKCKGDSVVDTVYVNPCDTTGTDQVFPND